MTLKASANLILLAQRRTQISTWDPGPSDHGLDFASNGCPQPRVVGRGHYDDRARTPYTPSSSAAGAVTVGQLMENRSVRNIPRQVNHSRGERHRECPAQRTHLAWVEQWKEEAARKRIRPRWRELRAVERDLKRRWPLEPADRKRHWTADRRAAYSLARNQLIRDIIGCRGHECRGWRRYGRSRRGWAGAEEGCRRLRRCSAVSGTAITGANEIG